jgi:hypothetical protein
MAIERGGQEYSLLRVMVMVLVSDIIREFVGRESTIHFEVDLYGSAYAMNKKKSLPARISIALPSNVCGENLHHLDKWRMVVMAIPDNEVEDFLKVAKNNECEICGYQMLEMLDGSFICPNEETHSSLK